MFRPYQRQIFDDQSTGIQILLWARQTGKSFTLAAWAVQRLLTRPGRLVTILSNSKYNGIELNRRCAEVCQLFNQTFEQFDLSPDTRFESFNTETRITINGQTGRIKVLAANPRTARGFSGDLILDEFAFHEDAAAIWEAAEPILASNPDFLCRIASTPNGKHNMFYRLCNLGSTSSTTRSSRGNETLTIQAPTAPDAHPTSTISTNLIPISRITRTDAWQQGCPVFHPITRAPINPTEARALAQNKRAYDQNYECQFEDQNMALLTHELISAAERPDIAIICEQNWAQEALTLLGVGPAIPSGPRAYTNLPKFSQGSSAQDVFNHHSENSKFPICNDQSQIPPPAQSQIPFSFPSFPSVKNPQSEIPIPYSALSHQLSPQPSVLSTPPLLFAGVDVARHHDQTVITILEKLGSTYIVRAILRLRDMRLPDQQQRLETILALPNLKHLKIDMTGLGLGLFEYTHQKFPTKVTGINFSSSLPLNSSSVLSVSSSVPSVLLRNLPSTQNIRITEHLATCLLQTFEDRALQIPIDQDLRDDLRKPERLVSPSGRVSIAAARDATGHADHFWSLALALDAAQTPVRPPPASAPVHIPGRQLGRAPRRHKIERD